MANEQAAPDEVVLKEYPHSTYWLDGKLIRAAGNLVLTSDRIIFLWQINLTPQQIEEIQKLARKATVREQLRYVLRLHQKNFELPLSSIVSAKMGLLTVFPLRPYLRVFYRSRSKKTKELHFFFTVPMLKRLLMSEFPTLSWVRAINTTVKARQRSTAQR